MTAAISVTHCGASGRRPGPGAVSQEPFTLVPATEPSEREVIGTMPSGPTVVDAGVATACPPERVYPMDIDVVPAVATRIDAGGNDVLQTLRFVVKNRVGVPRNVEVVEVDRLASSSAPSVKGARLGGFAVEWDSASPVPVLHSFFDGGFWGPPGTRLVLPANAAGTAIVELEPTAITAPKRGVRVHLDVDGRPLCYEQILE